MNLYNEIDPYCCDWLENLIREKLIPDGIVDRRSIVDIVPNDLRGFIQCHFFAGLGGWPLALRRAGYPDHKQVWTGSCPCQPFSQAGKRLGFADDRHLWPYWRYLIQVLGPAVVFGEQVASAADWLGLVRGDLEALEYAVGCMPIEAASAGADHLRDRFWFVAHDEHAGEGRGRVQRPGESAGSPSIRAPDQFAGPGNNGFALGDAHESGSQGRGVHAERGGERIAGATGMEYAARLVGRSQGRTEHELWGGRDATSDTSSPLDLPGVLSNTFGTGIRSEGPSASAGTSGGVQRADEQRERIRPDVGPVCMSEFDWVIGADGKARRVKSGIRLLAHGVPNRVAKLRAFGNAIDPRPAAAFIKAAMQALDSPPHL